MANNYQAIAPELRASCRWVVWRLEDQEQRKALKVPYQVKTGKGASHANPDHWASFADAIARFDKGGYNGIGLVIGRPFIAVDLDHCRDAETGNVEPWAVEFLKELNSYTELSQSGSGFHVWLKGEAPADKDGVRKGQVEAYAKNRYLTMTGLVVPEYPTKLRELSKAETAALFTKIQNLGKKEKKKDQAPTPADSDRLEKLMAGEFEAAGFNDISAAVMALLTLLAVKHMLDPKKIEEDFKASGLYKDFRPLGRQSNWIEKWDRLGADHLKKAIEFGRETLQKKMANKSSGSKERTYAVPIELIVRRGKDTPRKHLKFLWEPVLPAGCLTHFGGQSSQGKSPVTIDLLARLTTGQAWPNNDPNLAGPRSAILMNVEDGFEDTILPRFDLACGDDSRLFYVEGTKLEKDEQTIRGMVALDRDIHLLCDLARKTPELGIVVLDPITNYLGRLSFNKEDEVRQCLTPLALLAQELGIVVLTVGHFNKSQSNDPLQRMMGAAAFVGVARSVWTFGRDPEAESPYSHIMSPARGSVGDESYLYHTEQVEMEWDNAKSKVIRVCWDGRSKSTAEDAVTPISQKDKTAERSAAEMLHEFLKPGKKEAQECLHYLKTNGFNPDTMNLGRVRKFAGAKTEKAKGSKESAWTWCLGTKEQPEGLDF
jgi:hypothetical protein